MFVKRNFSAEQMRGIGPGLLRAATVLGLLGLFAVSAASVDPKTSSVQFSSAARAAILRGEDPGAYMAQIRALRHPGKALDGATVTAVQPGQGSALHTLASLLRQQHSENGVRVDAAMLRHALGEVALLRSELQSVGDHLRDGAFPLALKRWQSVDQVQGANLHEIESALQLATRAASGSPGSPVDAASLAKLRKLLMKSIVDDGPRILGARDLPVSSPEFAPRPLPELNAVAPSFASTSALPGGADDLVSTHDAAPSTAILDKARSLGFEPVRIHDFVRTQMHTEWYAGAQKGADETLRSGGGNDADQASLLIALLRASSMPARYVKGVVELPIAQLGPMFGVNAAADIGRALAAAGIANEPVIHGNAIDAFRIEHIFVSTYVPYGNYRGTHVDSGGKAWIPLAPAIKDYAFEPAGDVLTHAGINAAVFIGNWLSQPQTRLPLDGLRDAAQNWLVTQPSQQPLDSQFQRRTIAALPLGLLPSNLPAKLIGTVYESNDLPDSDRQWLRIRLHADSDTGSPAVLDHRIPISDLLGRRLTLSYQPATEDDQNLIRRYGSLALTPAYLLRMRARLMLRGEPDAISTSDWIPGSTHSIELISETPAGELRTRQQLIVGGYTAITIGAQAGATPLSILDVPNPNDSEFAAAQRLASLGLRYANAWDQGERQIADLVGVLTIRPAPSIGLTFVEYQVQTLLGLPMRLTLKGVSLDAAQRPTQPISDAAHRARESEFLRYTSLHGSALEHQVFENDWGVASISADKGLQLATQAGIARLSQTGGVLPASVALPANVRDEINAQLARGWRVDLAASELALNLWSGAVWHAEDTATGASGWFIAGRYAGGATTEDTADWPLPLDDPNTPGTNEDPNAVRYIDKITDGDFQFVEVDQETESPLSVRVTDKRYVPVEGAIVVFRMQLGQGQVKAENGDWGSEARALSDDDGRAGVAFKPAARIELGREVFLNAGDEFPTFVGLNRIGVHAETAPDQGAQLLARVVEPFTVFAKPAAVSELVTQRYPLGVLNGTVLASIYEGDWLILARDAHQNVVSNASIEVASEVDPPAPDSHCDRANDSGGPLYFLQDECPLTQVLTLASGCGTSEKTLLSSTQWTENPVHVIAGQTFGATYRHIARSAGAQPLVLSIRNDCYLGNVKFSRSLIHVDRRGAPIEAQLPGEQLDYRRKFNFYRYEPTDSTFTLRPYEVGPALSIVPSTSDAIIEPMVSEGAVGAYSTQFTAASAPEFQEVFFHWINNPEDHVFALWGFYTVDFGISADSLERIELDESGYTGAWSLPWHWARPPLSTQSTQPLLDTYPLERTLIIERDGEYWSAFRAGYDDAASSEGQGAIDVPAGLLRFDEVDDHEYTAHIVLHRGSPAQLRSESVVLKFGRPILERYGLGESKALSAQSASPQAKTTQGSYGRYPSRLKIKETIDRPADRVCYASTAFVFELYRDANVEVLAYPISPTGAEGSPLTIIASNDFEAGEHRQLIAPFELPWGEYRLEIKAKDSATDEEEMHEASLSNDVEMIDALPLAHSIVKNVDLHDGNLGISRADIDLGGRGPGLRFTRSYSSPRPSRGDFGVMGYGWHTNLESGVNLAEGCGGYLLSGADGGAQRFVDPVQAGDGTITYKALHGYHGTLTQHSDGTFDYFSIDGTRYRFERAIAGRLGRLAEIVDADGSTISYRYAISDIDGEERVVELRDSAGRVLSLQYSAFEERITLPDGNGTRSLPSLRHSVLTSISGPLGLKVSYAYSPDGMLISATRNEGGDCAPGQCETYDYTDLGRSWYLIPNAQFPTSVHHGPALTRISQRGNGVATFDYDLLRIDQQVVGLGVVQIPSYGIGSVQEFDGSNWRFTYTPTDRGLVTATTKIRDGRGNDTTHTLNHYGAAERVQDPAGTTVTTWDFVHYKPATVTDALGRTTTYTYDEHGNTLVEAITAGIERRWTYEAPSAFGVPIQNRAKTYTDARGIVETYQYDTHGHLTHRARGGEEESFGYDSRGDRTRHSDFNGNAWSYTYDSYGYPFSSSDPLGHPSTTRFDVRGRLLEERDANSVTMYHDYDGSDRRIRTSHDDGSRRSIAYDQAGRKQTLTDELGQVTVQLFDPLGRLIEVRNALGGTRTLQYDGNGNIERATDFRGNATVNSYDDANRLTTRTEPLGKITTFSHDALGHVLTETIAGPNSVTRNTAYTYTHPLYFQTRIARLGGQGGDQITTIAPDNAGNPVTTTDALGRLTTRTFDAFDRVTLIDEPGRSTTSTYDANGNPLTETIGNRTRGWTYDAANRNVSVIDGNGQSSTTTYFPAGQVESTIDPRGGIITYVLDGRNRIEDMRGPRNDQVTHYTYDATGNRTDELLSNGRSISHVYDALNRLESSSDVLRRFLLRAYDADGNVTAETDARNNTSRYVINALNQRLEAQLPEGRSPTWTYSVHGDVLTETSASGHLTTHTYDALGQRLTSTLPNGSGAAQPRAWTYDAIGNVLSQTDSNGQVTTFGYDDLNRKIRAQIDGDDGGAAETWTYDPRNTPKTYTDRAGIVSVMTYDKEDRLLTRTRSGSEREVNTYDGNGNAITQSDPRGTVTTNVFDAANQKTRSSRDGKSESWTYTPTNQIATHTSAVSNTTTFEYDIRDRLTSEENAEQETRSYTLDPNGNRTAIELPHGKTWTQTFDDANRLTSVHSPEGHTTGFDYHSDDQLAAITDANQHQVTLTSDALARINARVYPGGATFGTVFDGEGNPVTDNNPDTTITRTFDALNRMKSASFVGASAGRDPSTITTTYDPNSNPLSASRTQSNRTLSIQRSFDNQNYLQRETTNAAALPAAIQNPYTHTQRHTLDPNGNRTTTTDAGNTTSTQSFDAFNRITSTTTPGEGATTNTWNADGTLATVSRSNGTATRYRYDRAQRIKTITHSHNAATTLEFAYAYDANGNREQETRTQSAIAGQGGSVTTTTYGYDNDDRLIETEIRHQPISVTTPDEKTEWTLDGVGNRQSEIVTRLSDNTITSSKIYTYNARDQLTLMHDSINLLDVAYTYDNNGNRTARTVTHQTPPSVETTSYIFDARDRLTGVQPNAPNAQNAPTIEYTYDADARRIERVETPVGAGPTATLYLYNGTTLVHEADPSNTAAGFHLTDTYRHSATLDRHIAYAQSGGSDIRYYQLDGLQTPVAMTDASGTTINRTAYSAWGEIEEQVADGVAQAPWMLPNYNPDVTGQAALLSNDGQSIGFTGYQKDDDTGLYYANARWYDPLVGSFNGMDPAQGDTGTPLSLNKYLYAHSNPNFFIDPDGSEVWGAQTQRLNELAYTNSPIREAQLREAIRVEGIRENARLGATMGYFRDNAIGIAEMAADGCKFYAERTGLGMMFGLDLGGAQAMQERSRKLGHAVLHPIDTFITPIQKMNALSAQLEAEGDIFGAAYVGHQAQLATTDVVLMAAGGLATARKLMLMRMGVRPTGPEFGMRDIDLDLDSSSIGSLERAQGPSTAPVVANVPDGDALGTVTAENADTVTQPLLLTGPSQGKQNAVRGNKFEAQVLDALYAEKNTSGFSSIEGQVTTVPDLPLNSRYGVTDIKDVEKLSFTRQLRAQLAAAQTIGESFNVIGSPRTRTISVPLQDAIRDSRGRIFEFDPQTGSFRSVLTQGNRVVRVAPEVK